MFLDVVDLRNFYAQPVGIMTRRLLGRAIRARFDNVTGMRVLGLGYPTPYLGVFREEAERCLAVMPAAQGVVRWPSAAPTLATLADETLLPFPTSSMDRVVIVHALEMTPNAAEMLREVWRVLAPGGRLLAVVPNRRGVWARLDTTPFGNGRPFSRGQVVSLLREALFTPVGWDEALYAPPSRWFLNTAVAWERIGARLSLPFSGVLVVEATKQLYRPVAVRRPSRIAEPALEPVLVPGGVPAG
ncbi:MULTISPECIES: class I SAM-dependent methyltransferase [Xanthobacter]|uniref:Methyltransferase type 11 n=1 Tax=Xanthobacter flavus TaxID=281 RepID=A0A9W6CN94_XANFL|nr:MULTISPECIES: class I SAM-dependent methyltransferase [Xanthobacter]MDR6332643.1 SAM-dependent methyltransferase [Xanthobacter flavus]NMN57962.1 SAM-dependent methyltransferase [Xanthobacter sp. SG618]UDQ89658.1 class I SAM-dependent methyltransferase [Xanthobacter autotrophicus]UJX47430.1 class I SAM-dependent methyltransferase [Xanthobacter sp. YC-JY1]GLI20918.1 methyltransferase type 11 [Xanthobacter flavus]